MVGLWQYENHNYLDKIVNKKSLVCTRPGHLLCHLGVILLSYCLKGFGIIWLDLVISTVFHHSKHQYLCVVIPYHKTYFQVYPLKLMFAKLKAITGPNLWQKPTVDTCPASPPDSSPHRPSLPPSLVPWRQDPPWWAAALLEYPLLPPGASLHHHQPHCTELEVNILQ